MSWLSLQHGYLQGATLALSLSRFIFAFFCYRNSADNFLPEMTDDSSSQDDLTCAFSKLYAAIDITAPLSGTFFQTGNTADIDSGNRPKSYDKN